MNDFKPLLALKDRPISTSGGFVIPIAYELENSSYSPADRYDFPNNGRIWVSSEYEAIDRRFSDYEFFRVNRYSADENEAYIENDYLEKYWMRGSDAEALKRFEMCPIIEEDLPEVEKPYLRTGGPLPNRSIFVNDGNSLYGPYEWTRDDEGIRLSAAQSPLLGLKPDHVFKAKTEDVRRYIIEFENFRNTLSQPPAAYLFNTSLLKTVSYDQLDYISDDRLVTWGNKHFLKSSNARLNRKTATEWLEAVKNLKNLTNMDAERRSRLIRLIPQMLEAGAQQASYINNFLTNEDEGKRIVEQYLQDNKEKFFRDQLKNIEDRAEKKAVKLKRELYFLRAKRDQLHREIEELNKKKIEEKTRYEQERTEELRSTEERIGKLIQAEDLYKEIEFMKLNKKKIETEIKKLKSEDITEKLTEIKTYLDMLNGSYTLEQESPNPLASCYVKPLEFNGNRKDFVDRVRDYLVEQCARNYTSDEIANLLICVQQSFLTILAGPPGTGKTSIVHYLTEALGNSENLLKIPVSRGWTSQRDILGYFNPLRSQYQKARTGLYDFLYTTQTDRNVSEFSRWVLLDEANLSPIEHYWADFLGSCDPEGERTLDTGCPGDERFLSIPLCVRFVGTVNNDNTTERLSPRLIDRVPVIRLEPSYEYSNPINNNRIRPDGSLPFENMQDFFSGSEEDDFASKEAEIIKEIIEILQAEATDFEGSPFVVVSPRKYYAIRRYCTVARDILVNEQAIDFAVAQYILPLIEGYGVGFGRRLEKLMEVTTSNSLYRSSRLLRRTIEAGKQAHNSYSFFS
ncbi:AAA family ATPase [Desulfobacterales bacterium HSG2]|nr:AAA family ATPase [Desulfobacterales bacterium HSG2]